MTMNHHSQHSLLARSTYVSPSFVIIFQRALLSFTAHRELKLPLAARLLAKIWPMRHTSYYSSFNSRYPAPTSRPIMYCMSMYHVQLNSQAP